MRNLIYGLAVRAERSCCGVKSRDSTRAGLLVKFCGKILGSLCNKTAESADKREQLLCNKSYGFIGIYLLVEHLGNSALGNLQNGEKNIFNSADRPVDSLLGSADGILNLGAFHSVNVGFFVRRIGYGKSSRFADSAVKRCGRFLLRKGIEPCRHNGHYHAQAKYNAECLF